MSQLTGISKSRSSPLARPLRLKYNRIMICKICGLDKPIKDYYNNKGNRCKKCVNKLNYQRRKELGTTSSQVQTLEQRRRYNLRYNYNLTPEEFNKLAEAQGEKCAICKKSKPLKVDHDHKTKRVRGLLCDRCNHGLGHFFDDPQLLQAAIYYLT